MAHVIVGNEIFHILEVANEAHRPSFTKVRQPKVGGRLSAYSASSQNARKSIAKSNREHKVIIGIGWMVVITTFTLNCMHMQAVVHVIQTVAKTYSVATAMDFHVTIGGNAIYKGTADF